MKYFIILSSLILSFRGFSKITPPKIDLKEVFIKLKDFNDPTVTRNLEVDFFKNLRFQNDSIAYFNPNGTLHLFKTFVLVSPFTNKGRLDRTSHFY